MPATLSLLRRSFVQSGHIFNRCETRERSRGDAAQPPAARDRPRATGAPIRRFAAGDTCSGPRPRCPICRIPRLIRTLTGGTAGTLGLRRQSGRVVHRFRGRRWRGDRLGHAHRDRAAPPDRTYRAGSPLRDQSGWLVHRLCRLRSAGQDLGCGDRRAPPRPPGPHRRRDRLRRER